MGYRQLLKRYVSHIQIIAGGDFIALAELTQSLTPRELGELRTIAAELKRETFGCEQTNTNAFLVRQLIENGEMSLEDLARQDQFDWHQDNQSLPLSDEKLRTILRAKATGYRS